MQRALPNSRFFLSFALLFLLAGFSNFSAEAQTTVSTTYNTPGTYTISVPPYVTSIKVEMWGGGGAGGGSSATQAFGNTYSRGGGGGGGAYKVLTINAPNALMVGMVYEFTVGAGGVGVNGGKGGDGEASEFNEIMVNGGSGGNYVENGSGTGGAGGAGDKNGGNGAGGGTYGSGGGGGGAGASAPGANATNQNGANGGTGGGGKGGNGKTVNNNGDVGTAPGGGGGGGYSSAGWFSTDTRSGGNGGNGQIIITYTYDCSAGNIWLGTTNTNWFTASNWCNGVPTAGTNVFIPASAPRMPVINGAGAVCKSITIDGTLTLQGSNTLSVNGDWSMNGTFTAASGSTVNFVGNTNATLSGLNTSTFEKLTINKGNGYKVTNSGAAFATQNDLTISGGNLTLQAYDIDYNIAGNLSVTSSGSLTHSVNWDNQGYHSLNVLGNITMDGAFNYTTRSVVRMNGNGSKTIKSTNPFSILLMQNGNFSAAGPITVNDNFWPMYFTGGSFSTNGQIVTANAGVLIAGGTVNINGGSLNVTGGLIIGQGATGTATINNTGTLNADQIIIGNNGSGSGTFTATGSPTINITGNWTNNGTFTQATSQVNFVGGSLQTIGGSNATTFYKLLMNNSGGVSLANNITVSNELNLTSGLITTGTNAVTAGGTITNASASSYINGRLARAFTANGSFTYPTGKGGNYRPLTFTFTTFGGGTKVMTVEQMEGTLSGNPAVAGVEVFQDRYWDITQTGGASGAFAYKVTLDATGLNAPGSVLMIKKEGNSTTLNEFSTVNIGNNYTNNGTFTTFNGSTNGGTASNGTNSFTLGYQCNWANAGVVKTAICMGTTTDPLGGSVGGGPSTVTWSSSAGGTFSPGVTTPNATWTPPAGYSGTAVLTLSTTGNCGIRSSSKNQVVNALPVITLNANYCTPGAPNEVQLVGTSNENISNNASNWTWSPSGSIYSQTYALQSATAKTTTAGTYTLTGKSAATGCVGSASVVVNIGVQTNLIVNGNFESGNTGFTSGHTYVATPRSGTTGGLYPEKTYTVAANPNLYHANFWGRDHTKADGTGNFMLVNVDEANKLTNIWTQTVTVTPNTLYYFTGWAVSLNNASPFANIEGSVNGTVIGSTGTLVSKSSDNNSGTWSRFYGTWNSGNNTSAILTIRNIENGSGGKDLGIDDLEFKAVSTYITRVSASGTDAQSLCAQSPLDTIAYSIGGDGSAPPVTGLPAGVSTTWNGNLLKIVGTPTTPGNYSYTVNQGATGCNKQTLTGTISAVPPTVAPVLNGNTSPLSVCYKGSGTIPITNSGSIVGNLTWKTSASGSAPWNPVANGNYLSISNPVYYQVFAKRTEKGCLEEASNILWVRLSNIWTGAAGTTDWNTVGNWADNKLPVASCPVTYVNNQGANPSPVITSGTVTVQDLVVETGKKMTLSGTAVLSVSGAITAPASSLDLVDAKIEFTGTNPQNIAGNIFKGRTIKDFVINNSNTASGVVIGNTVGDTLNITGSLTFGSSGRKLTTGDNLTLKSTASGTANIGVLTSNNVISGKVLVERYITNHKAWHFFSAPTKGSTFNASWQAGNTPGINTNSRPGYGTMLTGTAGTIGYDYTSPQSSLRYFDNVSNSYKEINNTLTGLVDGYKGYMVFVRGDRSVKPTDPGYSSTTLYTKGILYTPAAPMSDITIGPGKWELIGNPYASAIDVSKFQVTLGGASSSIGSYYIWDPNLTSGPSLYGLGAFRAISGNIVNPSGGNYVTGSVPPIQSGQAFFVKNTSSSANMVIKIPETAKVSGSTTLTMVPNANSVIDISDPMMSIRANLHRVIQSDNILLDGTIVLYHPTYDNGFDMWDAEKLTNPNSENMGIISNEKVLSIERKNMPVETDSIFYKMNNYKVATYRFELVGDHFDLSGLDAFLYDKFLDSITPLNSNGTVYYTFNITSNPPGSWDERRFSIFFRSSGTVPVTLTNVKAYTQNKDISVEWTVATESNMKSYTVEVSADGNTFTAGGTLAAKNVDGTVYQWLHKDPGAGIHYYRIKSTGLDGKVTYSKIVNARIAGDATSIITVFPNPIKDGVLNIQFDQQAAGTYQVRVLNTAGQLLLNTTLTHGGGTASQQVRMPATAVKGVYHVEVWKGDQRVMSEKVIY